MTRFVVELDDEAAEWLRRRADRQGIEVTELAWRLLAEAIEQDPYEFVGAFDSEILAANDTDEFLREHGFGAS